MITLKHVGILFICVSMSAAAQQNPAPEAPAGQPSTSSPSGKNHLITLDVVVTGKDGKPVAGLEKQDFTILDDKHPDDIVSFQRISNAAQSTDSPTQAILVIDTVNTSFETLSRERQQLDKFFQQNNGQLPLPVSLVMFSYQGLNIQSGFSRDGKAELDFLDKNPVAVHSDNRAQGEPGQFDRIERSLSALRALTIDYLNIPGNKLLIWVSPGWPVPMESNLGLSPKEKDRVFNRIVAASGLLLVSHMTLYSADPLGTDDASGFSASRYRSYLTEIRNPSQPQIANLALQVFAIHSGGQVFTGSNDLAGALNTCIEDATASYSLSFDPPKADHPNEYHHLEIKIDKPGLKARTRAGYYIQP